MIGVLAPTARLVALAAIVASAIAWFAHVTEPRIAHNRERAAREALAKLLGVASLPVDFPTEAFASDDVELCDADMPPTRIVRGRARGYAGDIAFVAAIGADARLRAVRVTAHQETPGLGDFIEADRSDWIHGFDGVPAAADHPLWSATPPAGIDAVSGATITSRGLVDGVRARLAALPEVTPCRR